MKIEQIKQCAESIIGLVDYYGLKTINVHELIGIRKKYDPDLFSVKYLTKLAKFSQSVIDEIDSGFASNSLTEEELEEIRTDGIDDDIGRKIIIIDKDSEEAGVQYGRDLEPDQTMTDFIMLAEKYDFRCHFRKAENAIKCVDRVRNKYKDILHYKPMDPSLAIHKAYYFIIGALYADLRDLRKASYFMRMEPSIKTIRKALKKDAQTVKRVLKLLSDATIDLKGIYKLDRIIEAIEKAIKGEDIEEELPEKYFYGYEISTITDFYELLLKYYNEQLPSGHSPFDFIDKTRVLMNMKIIDEFNKGGLTTYNTVLDQMDIGAILSTVAKACMIQHFAHGKCDEVDDIYSHLPLNNTEGDIYYNEKFTDTQLIKDFNAFRFFIEPKRINEVQELYMKYRKEK